MASETRTPVEDTAGQERHQLLAAMLRLPELPAVEELVRSKLSSDAPGLSQISQYLFELGGKRIRPAICILAARMLHERPLPQALIDIAAGIELIHMATLLHDDIIDHAALRRHRQSPYRRFGLGPTLLCGDFLYVKAFGLCAHLDHFIIEETERTCIELTEGEILEVPLSKQRHDLTSSLTIARKKTAALFRLATISAAHLCAAPPAVRDALAEFGEELGLAFQILDDVLDVSSTEDLLGKPIGSDLLEQKPSVVNVLWLQTGSELARKVLTREDPPGHDDIAAALAALRSGPVLEEARQLAHQSVARAENALTTAAAHMELDQQYLQDLRLMVAYSVKRLS